MTSMCYQLVAAIAAMSMLAPSPLIAQTDAAPRVSGYISLVTDYRSRGLSQSDGRGAAQIGLDYQHPRGFFIGGWASTVEFAVENAVDGRRRTELDYYVGYEWRLDDWAATATLARYTYPGGSSEYDYSEITGGVSYRDRLFLTSSRTSEYGSRRVAAIGHELVLALPIQWGMELGATIGRFELEHIPASRYTYWNIGLTKLVGRYSIDLRFHDNTYGITNYLGDPAPDQWVLALSYALLDR
jgi:uncharacterized protein (TIGR02001 family)